MEASKVALFDRSTITRRPKFESSNRAPALAGTAIRFLGASQPSGGGGGQDGFLGAGLFVAGFLSGFGKSSSFTLALSSAA